MFNLHVVLSGHDKVTDAESGTMCRLKVNGLSLPTNVLKNQGIFEKWALTRKQFEDFGRNKSKDNILDIPKNPVVNEDPKAVNWISSLQTVRMK